MVGVARDSKYLAVFEQALPYMYLPLAQQSFFLRVLQVRTTAPPERFVDRLRLGHCGTYTLVRWMNR